MAGQRTGVKREWYSGCTGLSWLPSPHGTRLIRRKTWSFVTSVTSPLLHALLTQSPAAIWQGCAGGRWMEAPTTENTWAFQNTIITTNAATGFSDRLPFSPFCSALNLEYWKLGSWPISILHRLFSSQQPIAPTPLVRRGSVKSIWS